MSDDLRADTEAPIAPPADAHAHLRDEHARQRALAYIAQVRETLAKKSA